MDLSRHAQSQGRGLRTPLTIKWTCLSCCSFATNAVRLQLHALAYNLASFMRTLALPEAFATLRRLLEARMGKQGKREFVQVLRLMEVFRIDDVTAGVRDAIDRGVIGFDAVKHLVLCRIERRPPHASI